MRTFLALLLFTSCLVAAPEPKPFGSWISPTGALKVEAFFVNADSPRTAYLFDPAKPNNRQVLCTFERSAEFLFSPDGKWIAMNDQLGSNVTEIRLFMRNHGLKFEETKIDPSGPAWKLLRDKHKVSCPDGFDHGYATVVLWSTDSKAILVSITGYGGSHHRVDNWVCAYDLRSNSATLDLALMNRETVQVRISNCAIRKCLENIIDDLAMVKRDFPELESFDPRAMKKSVGPHPNSEWWMGFVFHLRELSLSGSNS